MNRWGIGRGCRGCGLGGRRGRLRLGNRLPIRLLVRRLRLRASVLLVSLGRRERRRDGRGLLGLVRREPLRPRRHLGRLLRFFVRPGRVAFAAEERGDARARSRSLGPRGLLRGWLVCGDGFRIRRRGGSLAEDVREGPGGIAAGTRGRRRRRRRRRHGGICCDERLWRPRCGALVTYGCRAVLLPASAVVVLDVHGLRSRLRRREIRGSRGLAPAARRLHHHSCVRDGGAQRACSDVFSRRGVAAPRAAALLRPGRPRSGPRVVHRLRRLHPRRACIASRRDPRPSPLLLRAQIRSQFKICSGDGALEASYEPTTAFQLTNG